jgi:lysozyme
MAAQNRMQVAGLIGAAAMAASMLITPFEGLHTISYKDPPGISTICYGHVSGVKFANDHQCLVYLGQDTRYAEKAVNRLVTVKISDKTKAALIDFTYNAGAGTLAKSTLLKKLNAGDIKGACDQLPRFVYAGGKKLNGLIKRREAERELCLSGIAQ